MDDNNIIVLDTPEQIDAYFLLARRGALKLEILGMSSRQGSAYKFLKDKYGYKGNKQAVLEQYEAYLTEIGVLQ